MLTAEQVGRLSKAAQVHIAVLERRIAELTQDLYESHTEGATDTRVHRLEPRAADIGLPRHSTIRLGTESRHGHYIDVCVHEEGGSTFYDGYVEVSVMGHNHFVVLPQAANLILVRAQYERRFQPPTERGVER